MNMPQEHVGNKIGSVGEDFVEWLCQSPFGKDFLFRGQQYPSANGPIELCDLLMLLDDTAILFEVKTARRDKKKDWTDEQWAEWANKRLQKAMSQLERGCNALLGGVVANVENERQSRVAFDPSCIKHIYGVTVVDHPTLDRWGKCPHITAGGRQVSVMTTTHEELEYIVTELSTTNDFVDYLHAREAFFTKNQMLGISELDLLANYKCDPDKFVRQISEVDEIIIAEGCWEEYAKLECRKRREVLDRPSFMIDTILDRMHQARHAQLPHIEKRRSNHGLPSDAGHDYAIIATELAQLRRLDRRVIGKKLIKKSQKCEEQKQDRSFYCKMGHETDTGFVFLVSTDSREQRMESLVWATCAGKLKMSVRRVIGIAMEPVMGGYGHSSDQILIDRDPAVDREQIPEDIQDEMLKQFGPPRQAEDTEFG